MEVCVECVLGNCEDCEEWKGVFCTCSCRDEVMLDDDDMRYTEYFSGDDEW